MPIYGAPNQKIAYFGVGRWKLDTDDEGDTWLYSPDGARVALFRPDDGTFVRGFEQALVDILNSKLEEH